jgi:hypothetical protein
VGEKELVYFYFDLYAGAARTRAQDVITEQVRYAE